MTREAIRKADDILINRTNIGKRASAYIFENFTTNGVFENFGAIVIKKYRMNFFITKLASGATPTRDELCGV